MRRGFAGRRSTSLAALPFAEIVIEAADQMLQPNIERFADPQQREHRYRAPRLNHLPVPDAKAVRNHVLLGELPLHSEGPDSVAQTPEKTRVMNRQFSAGPHASRLWLHEQKDHEQKCVLRDTIPFAVMASPHSHDRTKPDDSMIESRGHLRPTEEHSDTKGENEMAFCNKCGAQFHDNMAACPSCGTTRPVSYPPVCVLGGVPRGLARRLANSNARDPVSRFTSNQKTTGQLR